MTKGHQLHTVQYNSINALYRAQIITTIDLYYEDI